MDKKVAARKIGKILDQTFPRPAPALHHTSIYTLLIAVLLSARATDKKVNEITPHLFKKANTPEKMIKLSIHDIEQIIRHIGLYKTKAKAIWNLSQILIDKYHGKVPKTLEELEELPGVGHKTASVVMAQGFHIPAFPVDTHIHRLAKRWGLSSGKNVKQTEKDLKELFPKKDWIKRHLQIIYFGRTFCPARGHKKDVCPICSILL